MALTCWELIDSKCAVLFMVVHSASVVVDDQAAAVADARRHELRPSWNGDAPAASLYSVHKLGH